MKIRFCAFGEQGAVKNGAFASSFVFVIYLFNILFIFHLLMFFCFFHVFSFFSNIYVSLLVSVSKFYCRCSLRSRCGVVMTQGGIAGVGLGHQLGREHDSNPQSGAEAPPGASASSRKKTECP